MLTTLPNEPRPTFVGLDVCSDHLANVLPLHLKQALSSLTCKSEKDCFIVGGAVRDILIGITPTDFDVVSPEDRHVVVQILTRDGWEVKDGRKDLRVLRASKEGDRLEIARYRQESETLLEDAQHRDLTINALYLNPLLGEVLDPLGGGLTDLLSHRILRFVGEPKQRIWEDFRRVFRFYRFAYQLIPFGFVPEEASLHSVRKNMPVALNYLKEKQIRKEISYSGLRSIMSSNQLIAALEEMAGIK